MVKNLPAVRETWVRSLRQEDPLEKGMATHSSILVWRIPWTVEPGEMHSLSWDSLFVFNSLTGFDNVMYPSLPYYAK